MNELKGKYRQFLIILLCATGLYSHLCAQIIKNPENDANIPASLPAVTLDQTPVNAASTTRIIQNPVGLDTIPPTAASSTSDAYIVDLSKVKMSSEGLDEQIDYGAKDSMWFDVEHKQVHLYGTAFIKYNTINLQAGYILLDYSNNTVNAKGILDSAGLMVGLPEFKDGEQAFSAKELRYNFKSKKGIIYEAYSQQEDLYVLGAKAKFVGTQESDTSKTTNTIYNKDAILTTCNAEHPHFGIHTKKLKIIPDKLVVAGLSNLEIAGIPTPLVLPFGFYPVTKTRKMGLIIPRDFDFSDQWGFGLKNIGYYIPINDNADVTLRSDVYFQGSFMVGADVRYLKKYKFNSNFSTNFNRRVTEDNRANKVAARSFGLRWTHTQDSKAHPTRNFGGSVNIETNRDQNRNLNDYQSVYRNTLSSNLTYRQTFPGKPYQFTAAMSHSQNTQSRQMTIELPNMNFTMQQIFPFKQKKRVGEEKWFEKVSLNYSSQLRNSLTATDTTLFTRETLTKAKMGIQHRASSSLPLKIFKYFTVAPNANYEENWYPYTIQHKLLDEDKITYIYDTVQGEVYREVDSLQSQFGRDTIVRDWGFKAYRTYNAGVTVNTALFFTKQFKKGWFRGVRHQVKPNASIGFGPDYTNPRYGYFDYYYRDKIAQLTGRDSTRYGIYDEGIFGKPNYSPQSIAVGYGLTNVLEMKYFSKRDTTIKKVKIFDNLAFRGSYVVTADSLKWTTISTGGLFRLFKGISNLSWNATFDPYIADNSGRRINKFAIKESGKLVRTTNLGINLTTNFTVDKVRSLFGRKGPKDTEEKNPPANLKPDDLLGWFERFSISHDFGIDRRLLSGNRGDTILVTRHAVRLSGQLPLNAKWSVNVGNIGYDFISKRITYPDFGFSRDLHCWEMAFSWQPERGTYNFFINVKPGTLDFLKVPYKRNNVDSRFGF